MTTPTTPRMIHRELTPGVCRGMGLTIAVSLVLMLLTPAAYAQRPSISQLQADLAALQAQLDNLEGLEYGGYLTIDETDPAKPVVRVAGANFQVVNGVDDNTINGLGNIIVGYDEARTFGGDSCSNGDFHDDESACIGNFSAWALVHKTGSHNVIVGGQHNYSDRFSLLVGYKNQASNDGVFAAGNENNAVGENSSILGGDGNTASGRESTVSGGLSNTASDQYSSVSGGANRSVFGSSAWAAGSLYESD
jgi:hypothetical protein